ncbi:ISC system 2Fe-2S type ferredoxin [Beggiatoa leptomitoformis]|uniref:2Fe-2S ferredoxin n=1 Tax=Beggiatoa leptomitoformis TaxID=288004 RepID=A0A2N9YEH3_9GAMM|nr:ISC system 2Fe-2S type ferredoxin [Beggiatoa leptomitoformis]ALG68881.1 ISC system 2Fe-2S type ferredoxin [Beggiatoa leptomitoformis]AUI68749.1 ISC system 2Fe-2S type ferredoxin [Beggiatoa leptomitoformis]
MPKITFLPHPELCPDGITIEVSTGTSVLDAALDNHVALEHACDKSCACTTCHIIIREGFDSLTPATDEEEDLLDKAWGLESESRLGCQATIKMDDLVVEIPKYTINYARENH